MMSWFRHVGRGGTVRRRKAFIPLAVFFFFFPFILTDPISAAHEEAFPGVRGARAQARRLKSEKEIRRWEAKGGGSHRESGS